jgi:glycine hydroxymethyltransferase
VVDRAQLLRSLERQERLLSASVVLTPVDSSPFGLADRRYTAFLHGLYTTDKVRTSDEKIGTVVQFGRRDRSARDLDSIYQLFAEKLSAAVGSLRLLSGLHAHTATFMSIGNIGDSVLLLPELAGGHFNSRAIMERLGYRVFDLPVDCESMRVDRDSTMTLIDRVRPEFLFVDRSEGLRFEDFSWLGGIEGITKVFDASQYLPQIIDGRYSNPLSWGFDLMLFSLHKSFPGPQKAGIVAREDGPIWERAGLTLLEDQLLRRYVDRMLETAVSLEGHLQDAGVPVVRRTTQGDAGWPTTQHVWITAPNPAAAFSNFKALSRVRIHVNYRKLPYRLGYGLRLGTTFSSVAGVEEKLMRHLARIIFDALSGANPAPLRHEVREIAESARRHALSSELSRSSDEP